MKEQRALELAVDAGAKAACQKSRRGVVIFHAACEGSVSASNGPPVPFVCGGSADCRAACREVAVHAEARALLAFKAADPLDRLGWELVHVKVVDGRPVPSGPPSCVRCSALILEAGIARVWLLHEDGLRAYSAIEFHALSLQHHGLPAPRDAA